MRIEIYLADWVFWIGSGIIVPWYHDAGAQEFVEKK